MMQNQKWRGFSLLSFGVSLQSLCDVFEKVLVEGFRLLFRQLARMQKDAEAEGCGLLRLQRVIERGFAFGEFFRSKRIDGKQSITTRVPVGRIGRVLRVIEDGDNNILSFDSAG